MHSLLFINLKQLSDFFEKLAFKGLTPIVIILLIYFYLNRKKIELSKSYSLLILLIFSLDLSLRIIHTFIFQYENNSRYFLVIATFILIPVAASISFISKRDKSWFNFNLLHLVLIVLFLYGSILSLRPKWTNLEVDIFSPVVKSDPAQIKLVYEAKYDENDQIYLSLARRLQYYSGIYMDKSVTFENAVNEGVCFLLTKKEFEKYKHYSVKLVSEITESDGDKKFLYKLVK